MAIRDGSIESLHLRFQRGIISRGQFVRGLIALGVSASIIGELVPGVRIAEAAHGIPGPAWQGGKPGGTLRVSFPDPIGSVANLDSSNGGPPYEVYWAVNQLLYRGLMFFGSGARLVPVPDMAEDFPQVSADGLTYTYRLRKGIRFHNGRECTADDFIWTWERTLMPSTGGWVTGYVGSVLGANDFAAGKAHHVAGFKALDRYTIQVKLTQPDVVLNSVLALPAFYPMPQEEVARLGKDWRTHAMGTGPYMVQKVDTVNNQLIAVKNPHYYYPQLPYLDQIIYEMNVPDTLAFERLARGDIDMVGLGIPAGVYGQVVTDHKYDGMWGDAPILATNYLAMDLSKPPFNNVKVRQAMNYAINKQRLARIQVATVLPGKTVYPPNMLGYDPSLKGYPYNPDMARQLLRQAGYPNGFAVDFAANQGSLQAASIAADMAAVGIKARVREYTADTIFSLQSKGSLQLSEWNYAVGVPDPSDIVGGMYVSNASYNFYHFSDPQIDHLATQGLAVADPQKRYAIYHQIEQRIVDQAALVFLSYSKYTTFHARNLHNALVNIITGPQFDRMWKS